MNLLIDENLSPSLVQRFAAKGVPAVHVAHIGLPGASDPDVCSARHEAFRGICAARDEIAAAETEARQAADDFATAERKLADLGVARGRLGMELVDIRRCEREHKLARRPWLERLRTFGRTDRPWRDKARALRGERARREGELEQVHADELHLAERSTALRSLQASLERRLSERRTWLGHAEHDEPGWPSEERARERCAPWDDREWSDARVRVFLGALELHRAFVEAEAQSVYRGLLRVAIDVLEGKTADLKPEFVQAAWAMLHLVIPVTSTTFASFERMFTKMGREIWCRAALGATSRLRAEPGGPIGSVRNDARGRRNA